MYNYISSSHLTVVACWEVASLSSQKLHSASSPSDLWPSAVRRRGNWVESFPDMILRPPLVRRSVGCSGSLDYCRSSEGNWSWTVGRLTQSGMSKERGCLVWRDSVAVP